MNIQSMQDRYAELCHQRDAVNAKNDPIEAKLAKINAQVCSLQEEARKLAAQIDDNRGREKWLELKKEIAMLARALSGVR